MRIITAVLLIVAMIATGSVVLADGVSTHMRTVEWSIVEPCDVQVSEGEVVLEWNDCGGDWEVVSFEYEDYAHPISVLFYAGSPSFDGMDDHMLQAFFCNPCCTTKRPDVYCADCNPCSWYCYKTCVSWCGEAVYVMAYLPTCMALDITDLY